MTNVGSVVERPRAGALAAFAVRCLRPAWTKAAGAGKAATERLAAPCERRRSRWALAGCLLIALLLRAPYLSTPLGIDEGGIAYVAQNWPGGHGSLYGSSWLDRPPLLVGLFKIAVLGGDRGVRLLGAIAAIALVVGVARLARAVAGEPAGRIAGLLAALLSGSVVIGAVYTPGELPAAVASTLSVLCLVLAHRRRQAGLLFAAGALAAAAVLIKQSFVDAGVAGIAFVAVSALSQRELRRRWPLAYASGAAIPLAALVGWQALARLPDGGFLYALVGFRLDALRVLAASDIPLSARLLGLAAPALASGLLVAVAAGLIGLRRLRGDRVLLVTFAAWWAAAAVGVLGGGTYWPHYLIELVPVSSVAAATVIATARAPLRAALLGACAAASLVVAVGGALRLRHDPPDRPELAVARYVRDSARAGDTQYVMYARANVLYYAGLPTPYPYHWSLMVRAVPGARARLQRLLGSTARPTWLVQWQDDDRWQLDAGERMDRLIARGYRMAAVVCGHPIYLRSDRLPPHGPSAGACPG